MINKLFYRFFDVKNIAKEPNIAANKLDPKIATFPMSIIAGSEKAKLSIKIDIVKPIPPKIPMAANCIQEDPSGKTANFNLTTNRLNKKIPKGLPTTSPTKIPYTIGGIVPVKRLKSKVTPALARAKRGIIKKLTQIGRASCRERV